MSDAAVDRAMFAFLASCVGDFVKWPQCQHVSLSGDQGGARLSGVFFKAWAMNPVDRTVFKITVTKDREWRARVVQVSNHIRLEGVEADRDLIVHAMDRFMELAGMVEERES